MKDPRIKMMNDEMMRISARMPRNPQCLRDEALETKDGSKNTIASSSPFHPRYLEKNPFVLTEANRLRRRYRLGKSTDTSRDDGNSV